MTTKATTPTVSVVITTYKRANLVSRAIHSVLRQTLQGLEVIVVDDCSPDNTAEVVGAIDDQRVRYIRHSHNKGLPAGRNSGIAEAKGEYVAFLDDDDEWMPEKLETQVAALTDHDAVLCGALVNGRYRKVHFGREITVEDLRRGNEFDPSGLLIRTSVVKQLGFDESLRQGEDWDAFIRIAQKKPIAYVAEPLLLYSDGGHARMTNEARDQTVLDLEKRMAVINKHRDFFGPYWSRYHRVDTYLSYIDSRKKKSEVILYAISRCGVRPVIAVLWSKIVGRIKKLMRYVFSVVTPSLF